MALYKDKQHSLYRRSLGALIDRMRCGCSGKLQPALQRILSPCIENLEAGCQGTETGFPRNHLEILKDLCL